MKKKITFLHGLFLLFIIMTSCGDHENEIKSSEKRILNFSVLPEKGIIDEAKKIVIIDLPFDADPAALRPFITVSAGATVSPQSGEEVDLSKPVTYTVTAEDESIAVYTLKATVIPFEIDSLAHNSLRLVDEIVINGKFVETNNKKVYTLYKDEKVYLTIKSETEEQIICQMPEIVTIDTPTKFPLYVVARERETLPRNVTVYPMHYPFICSVHKKTYGDNGARIILTGYNFVKVPDVYTSLDMTHYVSKGSTAYYKFPFEGLRINNSGTEIIVDTATIPEYMKVDFTGKWSFGVSMYEKKIYSNEVIKHFD